MKKKKARFCYRPLEGDDIRATRTQTIFEYMLNVAVLNSKIFEFILFGSENFDVE